MWDEAKVIDLRLESYNMSLPIGSAQSILCLVFSAQGNLKRSLYIDSYSILKLKWSSTD